MDLSIETLPAAANNCEWNKYVKFKFTSNSPLKDTPLEGTGLERFNTFVFGQDFEKYAEEIQSMKVLEDDVWILSYPKCGITWTMENIWQICNDVDTENKGKLSLFDRVPYLELSVLFDLNMTGRGSETSMHLLNKQSGPRIIKSHLPICFLPKKLWTVKPKIVYVTRNPKDAAVSAFHHFYNLHKYNGTKEEFFDLYLEGLLEYGQHWDHAEQFHLLKKHYPNMKILMYEDLKKDLTGMIRDLCNFLNKPLSEEKIQRLTKHLEFDTLKTNKAVNYSELQFIIDTNRPGSDFNFIRRGQANSYKDEMPAEYIEKFEKMNKERFSGIQIYQ